LVNKKQLEYFLSVCSTGSITKAAQKLYLSPQGLSKTILALESEIGVPLFDRAGRKMVPTAAGQQLKEHARRIVEEYELIEKGDFLRQTQRQVVRVFYTYGVMDVLGAAFIKGFCDKNPDILLSLSEIPDSTAIERLRLGEGDMALVSDDVDTGVFHMKKLFEWQYCIVAHKNHPLAQKEQVVAADLSGWPMIVKGREFGLYHQQTTRSARQGIETLPAIETTSYQLAHRLAAQEMGIAYSLLELAKQDVVPDTVICPLPLGENSKVISLVRLRGRELSPAAKRFADHLSQVKCR